MFDKGRVTPFWCLRDAFQIEMRVEFDSPILGQGPERTDASRNTRSEGTDIAFRNAQAMGAKQ